MRFALGTQGWSYADWVGTMYDAAARPESYLHAYAQEFATVEIDSTFYGTPSLERVRKWAASVPDGFTFSCKLPREITHERRLRDCDGLVRVFYDTMRVLGPKLGCVLVQFEASFGRSEEGALRAALAAFPRDVRTAFEFRDPAWYASDEIQQLLETHGHALAVADAPFVPRELLSRVLASTTLDFAYVRWIGHHDSLTRFDVTQIAREDEIAWWQRAIVEVSPRVKTVYGYVNNHYAGHSPATVRALFAALGVAHLRPTRIEQTSLF